MRYDFEAIEKKWRKAWDDSGIYKTSEDLSKPKLYCLDFFPYPSGSGLSVGHCRNYIPTDVFSRYFRMKGFRVLHPMGWDAFGLPAENYAIKVGVSPHQVIRDATANYKRQMNLIGTSYDWEREINSTSPEYYRWTQWFFLLLLERGLAYQDFGQQWWCPDCQTVLANENVNEGKCWRCNTEVVKKPLKQWFFKITEYADRLLKDLDGIDWPEPIKMMQRNWIGKSEGAEVTFKAETGDGIVIFTTRPDTLYGATYMVLAPEHPLVPKLATPSQKTAVEAYVDQTKKMAEIDRLSTEKEKTGVFTGSYATNPVTNERIPIWIGDYVIGSYGTGAIMCVPAHDTRDYAFAKKFNLPIVQVISPDGKEQALEDAYTESGIMFNSGKYNGMDSEVFKRAIVEDLSRSSQAKPTVNFKMRDWLISRQRYWGAPIPVIHCEKCGTVPVPKDQLPITLPDITDYAPSGDGKSSLARATDWVNATCPKCGGKAQRETDTMDGFACSSWYFLRFTDPHNGKLAFDRKLVDAWLPVDVYVGGAEHAVMHLIYARFWTKVMFDAGLIGFSEPFAMLKNQGMMLGSDHQKMSKSKGNVVTPDSMVDKYGADALRGYIMFIAPFEGESIWDEQGCAGVYRFLNRVWDMVSGTQFGSGATTPEIEKRLRRLQHKLIIKVSQDIERFHFNTVISTFMETFNEIYDLARDNSVKTSKAFRELMESYVVMLAPVAPYLCEEMWELMGHKKSIHLEPIPKADPSLAADDTVKIPIQINGKLRDVLEVPVGTPEDEIRKMAMESEVVNRNLEGRQIVQIMVPKGKIVSIVAK